MRQRQFHDAGSSRRNPAADPTPWWWTAWAAGAVLRLILLDAQEFWHDEVLSLLIAGQQDLATTVSTAARLQFGAAGYFAVLHAWLLTSRGEFAVRLLSVAGDLAALWVTFLLIDATLPPRARPAAAWLTALLPLSITYAKEVRGYSWLAACELTAALWLWRGMTGGGRSSGWAVRFGAALTAAALLHPGVWIWWSACATAVLLLPRPRGVAGAFALASLPAAVLTGALSVAAREVWSERLAAAFMLPAPLEYLRQTAVLLTAGHHAGVLAVAVLPWCAAGLLAAAVWQARSAPADRPRLGFLAIHALVPVAAVWIGIALKTSSQLRYVVAAAPMAILLGLFGAAVLPRWARQVVVAGLLAAQAQSWSRSLLRPPTLEPSFCLHSIKPVRKAAAVIAAGLADGDVVVHLSTASLLPMRWYLPGVRQEYLMDNPDMIPAVTRPLIGAPLPLARAVAGARRLWLVSCPWRFGDVPEIPESLHAALDACCDRPVRYQFAGLDVYRARLKRGSSKMTAVP